MSPAQLARRALDAHREGKPFLVTAHERQQLVHLCDDDGIGPIFIGNGRTLATAFSAWDWALISVCQEEGWPIPQAMAVTVVVRA